MKRTLLVVLVAAAALSFLPAVSSAKRIAPLAIRFSPLPERVATADAVVAGKVTSFEDKTVSAEPFAGAKEKAEFQIAVIKIEDAVLGAKGLTHVKVGTVKPPEGKPIIRPGGYGPPRLTVDQEGIFFLQKHPTESFYVLQGANSVINKASNDNFDKQLARAKECAKLLADPKAGLKSKEAEDRALTASMLVIRYRTPIPGQTKTERIDAEESKSILTALAGGDWTKGNALEDLNPQWGFNRLGLTDKDGWNWQPEPGKPVGPNDFADAAKAWLKGHADSYRIERYVSDKKDEKKDK
ncbi:MAG TPA: hypothetical protein VKA46_39625 [Gemmataceae bacterium]|nr:hypothetical protein [Gemmataceae bacterium]